MRSWRCASPATSSLRGPGSSPRRPRSCAALARRATSTCSPWCAGRSSPSAPPGPTVTHRRGSTSTSAGRSAAAVAEATDGRVPVVAQGSIVDVGQAEWAIVDGVADAVEMTRAQIADADLVAKLARRESRADPAVRPVQPDVPGAGQPQPHRELHRRPVPGTRDRGRPGDGRRSPPGRRAHGRWRCRPGSKRRGSRRPGAPGHLFERAAPVRWRGPRAAAKGSGRERLSMLVDWLESECRALGRADRVPTSEPPGPKVSAEPRMSGGDRSPAGRTDVPRHPSRSDADRSRRRSTTRNGLPDGRFLIWDPIGGPIGVSVAELLAADGSSGPHRHARLHRRQRAGAFRRPGARQRPSGAGRRDDAQAIDPDGGAEVGRGADATGSPESTETFGSAW